MSGKFSYSEYVSQNSKLYVDACIASGNARPMSCPALPHPIANPVILIVAPHPDDECLMGSYALRLKEEFGAKVYVVPFSYGSNVNRQAARKEELKAAVQKLGFELIETPPPTAKGLLQLIDRLNANMVFSPHEHDGHPTHLKAHEWTKDVLYAIKTQHPEKKLIWVQTEFWQDMAKPNLLVPLKDDHVIQLGEALACHAGEVARNPYHLRLPAWFQDQVRKGSERVSGTGAPGIDSVYGQLYFVSHL